MRKLLMLLCFAWPLFSASPGYVKTVCSAGNGTCTGTVTTANDLIVVHIGDCCGTHPLVTGVSDGTNAYAPASVECMDTSGDYIHYAQWYGYAAASGSPTFTVTWASGTSYQNLIVVEYSGAAATGNWTLEYPLMYVLRDWRFHFWQHNHRGHQRKDRLRYIGGCQWSGLDGWIRLFRPHATGRRQCNRGGRSRRSHAHQLRGHDKRQLLRIYSGGRLRRLSFGSRWGLLHHRPHNWIRDIGIGQFHAHYVKGGSITVTVSDGDMPERSRHALERESAPYAITTSAGTCTFTYTAAVIGALTLTSTISSGIDPVPHTYSYVSSALQLSTTGCSSGSLRVASATCTVTITGGPFDGTHSVTVSDGGNLGTMTPGVRIAGAE